MKQQLKELSGDGKYFHCNKRSEIILSSSKWQKKRIPDVQKHAPRIRAVVKRLELDELCRAIALGKTSNIQTVVSHLRDWGVNLILLYHRNNITQARDVLSNLRFRLQVRRRLLKNPAQYLKETNSTLNCLKLPKICRHLDPLTPYLAPMSTR